MYCGLLPVMHRFDAYYSTSYSITYPVRFFVIDLNSLPNVRFLDQSKLKAFSDDKIIVTSHQTFFLGWVENIVGKGENAGNQHFLLFPQYFRKAFFSGSLKVGIVWERVKSYFDTNFVKIVC